VVGANGTILRTDDGGETWQDQESDFTNNLYAVEMYGRNEAIAVGQLGRVLWTNDSGQTWKIQPNITNNTLQAAVYRGGANLWIAGRGGAILKRSRTLSPVQLSSPKTPPILRFGNGSKNKPKSRTPLFTVPDDGDIPPATQPAKENN
jgi:hypothetical protein